MYVFAYVRRTVLFIVFTRITTKSNKVHKTDQMQNKNHHFFIEHSHSLKNH